VNEYVTNDTDGPAWQSPIGEGGACLTDATKVSSIRDLGPIRQLLSGNPLVTRL